MKPAAFDYIRAETRRRNYFRPAEHGGEARVIAGGQSLVAMLNMRLAKPAVLVDIMRVTALATISVEANAIVIARRCAADCDDGASQLERRGAAARGGAALGRASPDARRAGRSAARLLMPIRAPRSRSALWRWAARCGSGQGARRRIPAETFSPA